MSLIDDSVYEMLDTSSLTSGSVTTNSSTNIWTTATYPTAFRDSEYIPTTNRGNNTMYFDFEYQESNEHTKLFASLNSTYFPVFLINQYLECIDFDFNGMIVSKYVPIKIGGGSAQLHSNGNLWSSYDNDNSRQCHLLKRNDSFIPHAVDCIKSKVLIDIFRQIIESFAMTFPMIKEGDDIISQEQRRFLISGYADQKLRNTITRDMIKRLSRNGSYKVEEIEQLVFSYPKFNSFSSFDEPKEMIETIKSSMV